MRGTFNLGKNSKRKGKEGNPKKWMRSGKKNNWRVGGQLTTTASFR